MNIIGLEQCETDLAPQQGTGLPIDVQSGDIDAHPFLIIVDTLQLDGACQTPLHDLHGDTLRHGGKGGIQGPAHGRLAVEQEDGQRGHHATGQQQDTAEFPTIQRHGDPFPLPEPLWLSRIIPVLGIPGFIARVQR